MLEVENQSKRKLWLWGGVIGLLVGCILFFSGAFVPTGLSRGLLSSSNILFIFMYPFGFASLYILDLVFPCHGESCLAGVFAGVILGGIIGFFVLGTLVGLTIQKVKSQKKLFLIFGIPILIFVFQIFLSQRDYVREQKGYKRDEKIIAENTFDGGNVWYISDYQICSEISSSNVRFKRACLESTLYPKEQVMAWKNFVEGPLMLGCTSSSCVIAAAIQTNNPKLCDYEPDSSRNYCYSRFIDSTTYKNNDATLCEEYRNGKLKDDPFFNDESTYLRCKAAVYGKGKDITLCNELKNIHPSDEASFKDICIRDVAINLKNSDLCKLAEVYRWESECIAGIAKATKNIDLCEDLKEGKNDCKYGVIIALGDKTLCSRLDESEIAGCLERFSH
jgi:hypothetical protein